MNEDLIYMDPETIRGMIEDCLTDTLWETDIDRVEVHPSAVYSYGEMRSKHGEIWVHRRHPPNSFTPPVIISICNVGNLGTWCPQAEGEPGLAGPAGEEKA